MAVVVGGCVLIVIIIVVSLVLLRIRGRGNRITSDAGSTSTSALGGAMVFQNPVYDAREYEAPVAVTAGYMDVSHHEEPKYTLDAEEAVA